MLWRLRQGKADVGARWEELAAIARRRSDDTSLVFASLHHLLALVAVGDVAAAKSLVAAISRRASAPDDDQGRVAKSIGVELAQALTLQLSGSGRMAALAPLLAPLGGSNAQRDVFLRALVDIAKDGHDDIAADVILATRGKSNDRFERMARAGVSNGPVSRRVA